MPGPRPNCSKGTWSSGDEILFSPSFGQQDPKQLAQWILDDRLAVRMQLQLHKLLWESEPGR